MQKTIVADNVSMCFNLASERVDSLKDLLIKKIKFQSCSFDEFWALNNISFSVDKGESCALIGALGWYSCLVCFCSSGSTHFC